MADAPPDSVDRAEADPTLLLLGFLDGYRDTVLRKLADLPDAALRTATVPSGWAPLGLLKHLACMERRWLRWGFTAEPVPDPFPDGDDEDGVPWRVTDQDTLVGLTTFLHEQAAHTRRIATGAALADRAAVGGRFATAAECPTLGWTLCHVLQEYARHTGHLDVARELADGTVGE